MAGIESHRPKLFPNCENCIVANGAIMRVASNIERQGQIFITCVSRGQLRLGSFSIGKEHITMTAEGVFIPELKYLPREDPEKSKEYLSNLPRIINAIPYKDIRDVTDKCPGLINGPHRL